MWVQLPPTASKITVDNLFINMRNGVLTLVCFFSLAFPACVGNVPPEAEFQAEDLSYLDETSNSEVVVVPGRPEIPRSTEGSSDITLELCDCRFQVSERDGLVCLRMVCSDGCEDRISACAESWGGCTIRR